MILYGRELFHKLEKWFKTYRHELIGNRGLLSEILSNAYCHGHKRDASLPITVMAYIGKRGLVITVQDQGKGFDVARNQYQLKKGKKYFHLAGNGMKLSGESGSFGLFYNNEGNRAGLLFLFGGVNK